MSSMGTEREATNSTDWYKEGLDQDSSSCDEKEDAD